MDVKKKEGRRSEVSSAEMGMPKGENPKETQDEDYEKAILLVPL